MEPRHLLFAAAACMLGAILASLAIKILRKEAKQHRWLLDLATSFSNFGFKLVPKLFQALALMDLQEAIKIGKQIFLIFENPAKLREELSDVVQGFLTNEFKDPVAAANWQKFFATLKPPTA